MNSDEPHIRASERFDQTGESSPETPAELEAWEDFSLIADHLQNSDPVSLPADFAKQVQREIRRVQRRQDAVLVLQTAFVTGLILMSVVATSLGFDWWQRMLDGVHAEKLAAMAQSLSGNVPELGPFVRDLYLRAEPFIRLLPGAFFCAAVAALLLEIAVFRLLRIGPFRLQSRTLNNSHNSLS